VELADWNEQVMKRLVAQGDSLGLCPRPRDLSHSCSDATGARRAAGCAARRSLRSPWGGPRVGSHRSPVLRPSPFQPNSPGSAWQSEPSVRFAAWPATRPACSSARRWPSVEDGGLELVTLADFGDGLALQEVLSQDGPLLLGVLLLSWFSGLRVLLVLCQLSHRKTLQMDQRVRLPVRSFTPAFLGFC